MAQYLKDIDASTLITEWTQLEGYDVRDDNGYIKEIVKDGEVLSCLCFWNDDQAWILVRSNLNYGEDYTEYRRLFNDYTFPMNLELADKILKENGFE